MHGLSYYPFQKEKHRTITLVFSKEKSVEGIQEALLNHRTAIYRGKDIIGSEEFLKPLFMESVKVEADYRRGTSIAYVKFINSSDFDFYCDYSGQYSLYNAVSLIPVSAHSTTVIGVKTFDQLDSFPLNLLVHNAITAPGKKLNLELTVNIESVN
jgi:hypothetical protein